MLIHFVCEGNTFRSRLAEAYLNSLNLKDVKATSSGTAAEHNLNGGVTWYAQRILIHNKIVDFTGRVWTQTSKELLDKADRVIFVGEQNYIRAKMNFGFDKDNFEVWDIKDLWELGFTDDRTGYEYDLKTMEATDRAFDEIRKKVDALVVNLGSHV